MPELYAKITAEALAAVTKDSEIVMSQKSGYWDLIVDGKLVLEGERHHICCNVCDILRKRKNDLIIKERDNG